MMSTKTSVGVGPTLFSRPDNRLNTDVLRSLQTGDHLRLASLANYQHATMLHQHTHNPANFGGGTVGPFPGDIPIPVGGGEPGSRGYVVGKEPDETGRTVPTAMAQSPIDYVPTIEKVQKAQNAGRENMNVGTWKNENDEVEVDAVGVIQGRENADNLATSRGEKAIFDPATAEQHWMPGYGPTP